MALFLWVIPSSPYQGEDLPGAFALRAKLDTLADARCVGGTGFETLITEEGDESLAPCASVAAIRCRLAEWAHEGLVEVWGDADDGQAVVIAPDLTSAMRHASWGYANGVRGARFSTREVNYLRAELHGGVSNANACRAWQKLEENIPYWA